MGKELDQQYRRLTSRFPNHEPRPVVGIAGNSDATNYLLNRDY